MFFIIIKFAMMNDGQQIETQCFCDTDINCFPETDQFEKRIK